MPDPKITIGFDLGDRKSRVCDERARVVKEAAVLTARAAIEAYFGGRERCRVVIEAGTHSPLISRQEAALGHEVIVANPSKGTVTELPECRTAHGGWTLSAVAHERFAYLPRKKAHRGVWVGYDRRELAPGFLIAPRCGEKPVRSVS